MLTLALSGFIFGYDTGQISGFLEMAVFLRRFGQPTSDLTAHPTGYYFTNVRSGLIVGLVCAPMFARSVLKSY
jgi:SP family sugar:H+ symporter-like MFS transporter